MTRLRALPIALLVTLILIPLGCSSDDGGGGPPRAPRPDQPLAPEGVARPERVIATILQGEGRLELIALRATSGRELPPSEPRDPVLAWELTDDRGAVVENGTITAPRLVTSEFDEQAQPSPAGVTAEVGVFEVELPNVGGTFSLFDPNTPTSGGLAPQAASGFTKLTLVIDVLVKKFASFVFGGPKTEADATEQVAAPASGCSAMTILLVSDGYTADQRAAFIADSDATIQSLSSGFGYADHWQDVAVHRKFFASRESGVSDPAAGIRRDTAFRVEHDPNVHRSISMAGDVPLDSLAKLAEAKLETLADVVLVVVNSTEWAGAAQPWFRIGYTSALSSIAMGHELGHALFNLADEYAYSGETCIRLALSKNVALSLNAIPWQAQLTPGVALPTEPGGDLTTIGAYEGAHHCQTGAYRPQQHCHMRELAHDFCVVCRGEIDRFFASRTAQCKGCGHDACSIGPALSTSCSPCVAAVCAKDPVCCSFAWDPLCVMTALGASGCGC